MERKRLTAKFKKAEDIKDGLFSGDVGNEERTQNYRKIDEYHTFEQAVNHELPDLRTEWRDNPREESGHGIPKVAAVYMIARNATKLAMLLLGDKVASNVIEDQAREFMRLGSKRLSSALNRYADSEELYTEPVVEEPVVEQAPIVEEPAVAEEAPVAPVEEAPVAPVEVPVVEEPVQEEAGDEELNLSDDVEIGEEEIEDFDDAEDINDEEIEIDEDLAAIFADDDFEDSEEDNQEQVVEAKVAKKQGIKKLGGQPKVVTASAQADELVGLWRSAPDVSHVFGN